MKQRSFKTSGIPRAAACMAIGLLICIFAASSARSRSISFGDTGGRDAFPGGSFFLLEDPGTYPSAGIFKGASGAAAEWASAQPRAFSPFADANVFLVLTASPDPVAAGSNVTYKIGVGN